MKKSTPLHILFLGIPSRGHTFPTLQLIKSLMQEGCKVTYFNTKDFKKSIEASGALFVDYDSHTLSNITMPITSMEPHDVTIDLQKIFFASALEIMPKIDFFHQQNNYNAVIYDQMALWGQLLADKYKLLSFCSNTMFLFDKNYIINQMPKFLDRINHEYDAKLSVLSSSFPQLKSYKDILDIQTATKSHYIITYYPENLHKTSINFNKEKIIYLGNRFNSQYFPSIKNFKAASTIYISLGTVFNEKPDLFKLFIDFFGKTKYKVIISTGSNDFIYTLIKNINTHNNIKIYKFINQVDILSRSSLFITHAGFNSMYEGLYFTVPMLMIPHVPEQYFNAQKVQELNAGHLLREQDISSISLNKSLNDIETNWQLFKSFSIKIRDSFLKSNDNSKAAKQIISFINGDLAPERSPEGSSLSTFT